MTKLFGSNPFRAVRNNDQLDEANRPGLERARGKNPNTMKNKVKWFYNTGKSTDDFENTSDAQKRKDIGIKKVGLREGTTVFGENPFHAIKEGKVKSAMMGVWDTAFNEHAAHVRKFASGKIKSEEPEFSNGDVRMRTTYVDKKGKKAMLHTFTSNGKVYHSRKGEDDTPVNEGFVDRVARRMTGTAGLLPKGDTKKAIVANRLNDALNKDVKDEKPYKLARTSKTGDPSRYPVASMKKRSDRAAAMRSDALGDEPEKDYTLGSSVARLSHSVKKNNIELDNSLQKMRYSGRGMKDTIKDITDTHEALRAQRKAKAEAAQKLADMERENKRKAAARYRANRKARESAKSKK